jgi:peptidoglycan/xylan/chitin deacetylase (PgdA/CDA1 family)
MLKRLALKVDVDTWRGTQEGVPRLARLLAQHGAQATFLFSLGPDHTGRAIKRVFRSGFLNKVSRTSVVEHYGLRTLLYGTLLPGPDIGTTCADTLRAVRDAGFEVGIHTWDHVKWQDGVERADAAWTQAEMEKACERFSRIFGERPRTHGAAGWQMNAHALRLTQQLGFDYCSDMRGTHPFIPVQRAELIRCPQIPTTLPTLDELIGRNGVTLDNVHEYLLTLTEHCLPDGHVYTLHAEMEGMKLLPVFERLLSGWRRQGYTLGTTRSIAQTLSLDALPHHEFHRAEIKGRAGTLMVQGERFLA